MAVLDFPGGNSEGLELIFHNQVLPHLVKVMSKDDATRFRVYEVRLCKELLMMIYDSMET